MTIAHEITQTKQPDVASLAADMAQTRVAFQQLLRSLSSAELAQPCVVSDWTVKEMLCHIVLSLEMPIPMMVHLARRSRTFPRFFDSRWVHRLNYQTAVFNAKRTTSNTLARRYDIAHHRMLKLLSKVAANEWQRPTSYPDGTPLTMTTVFHVPTEHFQLHAAWIPNNKV